MWCYWVYSVSLIPCWCREESGAEAKDFHGFFDMQESVAFWETFRPYLETVRRAVYELLVGNAKLGEFSHRSPPYWALVEETAKKVTDQYMKSWAPPGRVNCLNTVICIDEAREFVRFESESLMDTLSHMNRAARLLPRGSIFVFMDTLGDINILDPAYVYPSARTKTEGSVQATFTDLVYWDLMATTEGIGDVKSIFDTESEWYLARFGRPLWGAALKAGYEGLVGLASAKLTKDKRTEKPELHRLAQIALLASRISVQVNPFHRETRELTGSYMAYVESFDSTARALAVNYPSDPLLSAAAQSFLVDGINNNLWQACVTQLSESLRNGLTMAGDRGELAGQILCCYAVDLCRNRAPKGGGILSVQRFLEALIGEDALEAACSREGLDQQATQCLLRGRVNFSHFIRVEGYTPNREDMVRFVERRAAVVCKKGQWGADLIIPVVLERPIGEVSASAGRLEPTAFPLPDGDFEPFPTYQVHVSGKPTETMVRCASEVRAALSGIGTRRTASMDVEPETKAEAGPTCSQSSSESMSGAEPGTYLLNAASVSYIIINCKNYQGATSRLPSQIKHMNPFSCGIEPLGREGPPRPYFALGMFFDGKVDDGPRHRVLGTHGAKAKALPRADHGAWVRQYGVTGAVVNAHMLHKGTMGATIQALIEETRRFWGSEFFEAQDRLRRWLQNPLKYGSVFEPKDQM